MTETGNNQRNTIRQSRNRRGGARLDKTAKEPSKVVQVVRGLREVAYKPQHLNRGSLKRHNFWRRVLYVIVTVLAIIVVMLCGKLGMWYAEKQFNEAHPATIETKAEGVRFGIFPASYAMAVEKNADTEKLEVGSQMAVELLGQPEIMRTIAIMTGEEPEELTETTEPEEEITSEPEELEADTKTTPEVTEEATEGGTMGECEFVLDIAEPDPNYHGSRIELTDEDRYEAQCIIEGEDNAHGFEGAVLVAQALHDAMETDGYKTIRDVRVNMQYTGWNDQNVSQSTLDAIDWVFDQGNAAVQHRILYFYSSNGGWHETQHFIIELGRHRFFDRWK